jgi:AcrR family transcriptional regulator
MVAIRRRLKSGDRKKQILAEAVMVFARSNYKSARVKDIADRIGISEAAIYNHFPSKKAIFLEILDNIQLHVLAYWKAEAAEEENALDALRRMGLAYVSRMKEHPNEVKVQFQAISEVRDADIRERLLRDHRAYVAFIEDVVLKGIAAGDIQSNVHPRTFAYIYDGMGVLANMMHLLVEERFDDEQILAMVDHLLAPIKA